MRESYDGKIDWVEFYREHGVERLRKSGAKHTGLCPLHENTKTPAFWFTTDNGMWKCEAGCGQGNPTQFLSLKSGITTGEADKLICERAGVVKDDAPRKNSSAPYDVAAYASEKGLDPALLAGWGITASRNAVLMPYLPSEAVRKRHRPGSPRRFTWVTRDGAMLGTLGLYGLFAELNQEQDTIALVEGESDCHAMWSLGLPALGVPGATTFKAAWLPEGVTTVLVHDEGDSGAEAFLKRVSAQLSGSKVTVKRWSTPGDSKDPSALFHSTGVESSKALRAAMDSAEPYAPTESANPTAATMLGARGLKCPAGWVCDERGIRRIDDETGSAVVISSTPVLLSRRLVDMASHEERIGVAYRIDGTWRELPAARDAVFTSKHVVGLLAPLGVQITSESARGVVRWLGALEQANTATLPTSMCSRTLGWCGDGAFLPTNPGDVTPDIDGAEGVVAAFRKRGTMAAWREAMVPHRTNTIFRFMLSAGLAAPLLRAVNGRVMFVYNWGSSKGGKTAALKAAVSPWGDPEVLMTTFNATNVGLERMAGLLSDLPFAIDERQSVSGGQDRIDNVVMSLASGQGRVRGGRDGGLQDTQHYRNLILATGEEPLTGANSKTGVATRALELFGSPFASEEAAADMHCTVAEHHGHAGPLFIERLMALGRPETAALVELLTSRLSSYSSEHASSHVTGVATVLAADTLASMWLFGAERADALRDAVALGVAVLSMAEKAAAGDVDDAACLWLEGWLASNETKFSGSSYSAECWGEKRGTGYLVFPSILKAKITEGGFSYPKTLRALVSRGAVRQSASGENTRTERVNGSDPRRVVWVDSEKLGAEMDLTLALGGEADVPF